MVLRKELFRTKRRVYYSDGKYYKYREIKSINNFSRLKPTTASLVIKAALRLNK